MAHRLTKIYTRTGDAGQTGLASGDRVAKHDLRIEASGTVDEANCAIGLVLSEADVPDDLRGSLGRVQNELFDLGAELSLPTHTTMHAEHLLRLEVDIDELNALLPPLEEFILPGGTRSAANCHLARAVCRRAERVTWTLNEETELNPHVLKYLNRLSDLLFVAARVLARQDGAAEVLWQHDRRGPTNRAKD